MNNRWRVVRELKDQSMKNACRRASIVRITTSAYNAVRDAFKQYKKRILKDLFEDGP